LGATLLVKCEYLEGVVQEKLASTGEVDDDNNNKLKNKLKLKRHIMID
jgi:hypothetical protein